MRLSNVFSRATFLPGFFKTSSTRGSRLRDALPPNARPGARAAAFALLAALNWLGKARCLFILLVITVLTQHALARRLQHTAFGAFHWRRR